MNDMTREIERRELERAAGLLGERWMREPSNSPSVARRATAYIEESASDIQ
jgi:hypothetical protein